MRPPTAKDRTKELHSCLQVAMEKLIFKGEEAMDSLEADDWELFSNALEDRQKVFANYRALEHLAATIGVIVKDDPVLNDLFERMLTNHNTLQKCMEQSSSVLADQLKLIKRSSKVTKHYSSGTPAVTRLIKFS